MSSQKYLKDFHLGTVHFVENLFKNAFKELLEDTLLLEDKLFKNVHKELLQKSDYDLWNYQRGRLFFRIFSTGLLEPEGGFFELMAMLPKHITGPARTAANVRIYHICCVQFRVSPI